MRIENWVSKALINKYNLKLTHPQQKISIKFVMTVLYGWLLFLFRSMFHIHEFGITLQIYDQHLEIEGNKELKKKGKR